ncbi:MAG: hypothetical protein GX800_09930 [Clostridiaceae bacterium]|nr:hypothetical protein [Clostridiaceae bacterium]
MIEFLCDYHLENGVDKISQLEYSKLLDEGNNFCVKINGKVFFEQPLFPVMEFLYFYLKWDKKHDFIYNTIESEENPMISFKRGISGWRIDSVWKQFDCKERFRVEDFIMAVEKMIDNISN